MGMAFKTGIVQEQPGVGVFVLKETTFLVGVVLGVPGGSGISYLFLS